MIQKMSEEEEEDDEEKGAANELKSNFIFKK